MNKAYKVIYNETTGTYVAVAEIATSHTKSDATIVTTAPNPQHTGPTGLRLKKMALSHLSVAALGVFTMMAMPAAHASWVNNATGGTQGPGSATDFGSATGTSSIAVGSDSSAGNATAAGNYSLAMGYGAKSGSVNSVAIGRAATVNAGDMQGVAIGFNAQLPGRS